jgi:2,3-bisphosphoglycerate-independent phosphoglycerate mutase
MLDGALLPHPHISRGSPLLMVVLDGVGLGQKDAYDAWHLAATPNLDQLMAVSGRYCTVQAHGRAVGLPSNADMGNSEVGHNALGSGRIVTQGAALVDQAIANQTIFQSDCFGKLKQAWGQGGTLHLIGLLSDGGVHSRLNQLLALMNGAAKEGVTRIRLHVLLDGRDVPDPSAESFVEQLEAACGELIQAGVDARIASGGGRMHITMDRYEADWKMVERGWQTHVHGDARAFPDAMTALQTFRAEDKTVSDQYLPAFVISEDGKSIGPIEDGDAVICFNYRGDRVIELSRAFVEEEFTQFDRMRRPEVVYAGMMEYDGDLRIPPNYLVDPPAIANTAGEYLVREGVKTLAISETHKFGHVTYFWNGNRSGSFDDQLEIHQEIPSDPRPFAEAPEMRAPEITRAVLAALDRGTYDFIRVNIANGDMVGHTGNLAATIRACEITDRCLGEMIQRVNQIGGRYLVTADHGNADDMALRDKNGNPKKDERGQILPRTAHSLNHVPLVFGGSDLASHVKLDPAVQTPGLANITATYLNLLGFQAPVSYEATLIHGDKK